MNSHYEWDTHKGRWVQTAGQRNRDMSIDEASTQDTAHQAMSLLHEHTNPENKSDIENFEYLSAKYRIQVMKIREFS